MIMHDHHGHRLSGASEAAAAGYQAALRQLNLYVGDPVATIETAITDSPGFVMGHALKAYLHLLGTEPGALAVAREAHRATAALARNRREQGHAAAIGHLLAGGWRAAGRVLEDVAIEHPRDLLALQAGHLVDFYTGDARMLRDRVARALPAWGPLMQGYHTLLGMHAFGLEETGAYDRAEAIGRRAVEIEPSDGWAQHAVAHVMEMQGRHQDGIAWMRANPDAWSRDSFFAIHNWWHLALYHLELGDIEEVLILYDSRIYASRSTVVLDMIDASALLWRLHLRGIDAGDRWQPLADNWAPLAGAGNYAFNDAHAMMAFVGAGRDEAAGAVLAAQQEAMRRRDDNALFTRDVGHPVTLALRAFGGGDHAAVVRLLRPVRNTAHRFGGSHAQRDLLDLTLIESAFRSGQGELAAALAAERVDLKPSSPLARLFVARAQELGRAA